MSRWRAATLFALFLVGVSLSVMALAVPTMPQSLQIAGHSGHLAEWSLAAILRREAAGADYSGSLTMEHTGLCSVDGPEKKFGEMRLRLTWFRSRMNAKVRVDGVECAYNGALSDIYTGIMVCPHRRPVPVALWIN